MDFKANFLLGTRSGGKMPSRMRVVALAFEDVLLQGLNKMAYRGHNFRKTA
jgi:hypothetical protein